MSAPPGMMRRIARLLGGGAARSYAVPAGSRVYAVGDIHGRADLLRAIHEAIAADAAAAPEPRRVVVYLGDYVDRGPHSREVIDLLLDAPLAGFEPIHLRGNHEAFLLDFLAEPAVGPLWLTNGGQATLASYGVDGIEAASEPERLAGLRDALERALPARHRAFLKGLAEYHVEGGYAFVHAGLRPGRPLEDQLPRDLLWIREPFLGSTADFGYRVVHGHTIVREPELRPNRVAIDTGAVFTDRLTCVVLAGTELAFLQT